MNSLISNLRRRSKIVIVLGGFLVLLLAGSLLIVYLSSLSINKSLVNGESALARQDVSYLNKNGTWQTAKYDADPQIPGTYRVYLITKTGFVIDRWRPIPGYLDTSDFKQLSVFERPATVNTVNGQTWRLYSEPIVGSQNSVLGLITVGKHIVAGTTATISLLDSRLQQAAAEIKADISVNGQNINVSKVNEDDVPYLTSFQIVSQYNEILSKSDYSNTADHLPNYIDPSYIIGELGQPSTKIIRSSTSGEAFLVQATPIKDSNGHPAGTLIVARSLAPFYTLLKNCAWLFIIAGLVLLLIAILVVGLWDVEPASKLPAIVGTVLKPSEIKNISFAKNDSLLIVNSKKLPITYASNQYYMCLALFGAAKKKWEVDELMEKFGGQHNKDSWRKVYDAVVGINKKFNTVATPKLIITNNKTYQINPELIAKVQK